MGRKALSALELAHRNPWGSGVLGVPALMIRAPEGGGIPNSGNASIGIPSGRACVTRKSCIPLARGVSICFE